MYIAFIESENDVLNKHKDLSFKTVILGWDQEFKVLKKLVDESIAKNNYVRVNENKYPSHAMQEIVCEDDHGNIYTYKLFNMEDAISKGAPIAMYIDLGYFKTSKKKKEAAS